MTYKFGGVTNAVLSQTTVTGVTDTLIGSVYLPIQNISKIRAMFGEQNAAYTATLTITRNTGGATLQALTSGAAPAEITATSIAVAYAGWYDIYLKTSNASGIGICTGIRFE